MSETIVVKASTNQVVIARQATSASLEPKYTMTVVRYLNSTAVVRDTVKKVVAIGTQGPPGPPGPPGVGGGGSSSWTYQSVTAAGTTTLPTQTVLLQVDVDCSLGNVLIVLPISGGMAGLDLRVKRIDASNNLITVQPSGGQTIDGDPEVVLYQKGECLQVNAETTLWRIV